MKTLLLLLLAFAMPTFGAEPPALEKADAKRILEAMDWKEVTVVAVLQGVDAKGTAAPIYATVVAMGTKEGRHQNISQSLFYDQELGWFFYEIRDKQACIWTKEGFREVKPWATW